MTHQERDRLLVSLFLAVVIHIVIMILLSLVDWQIRDYPEPTPVFVELPEYESTPPAPVPEPPEPEVARQPEEVEPVPPEPVPQPQLQPRPQTTTPAPGALQPPPVAAPAPPRGTDAPPGSFSTADLPWLSSPGSSPERETGRTSDDLFRIDEEPSPTGELPAWVAEGTIQPLSSLDAGSRESLEAKSATVPGFQERLDAIIRSVDRSTAGPATPSTSTPSTSGDATGTGDPRFEWLGGGTRTVLGELGMPDLTSADFGGLVPGQFTYILVFDVNADGLVVPGSLIFRQSSGYTAADQKVRRAVATWRFESAPGSAPVTAICTLEIERDTNR